MYFLLNMGIFHCYVSLPEYYIYIPTSNDKLSEAKDMPLEADRRGCQEWQHIEVY